MRQRGQVKARDQSSRCEMMVAADLEISGCIPMCLAQNRWGQNVNVIYILHPLWCLANHFFSLCSHSPWRIPLFGLYLVLPCFRIIYEGGLSRVEAHDIQKGFWLNEKEGRACTHSCLEEGWKKKVERLSGPAPRTHIWGSWRGAVGKSQRMWSSIETKVRVTEGSGDTVLPKGRRKKAYIPFCLYYSLPVRYLGLPRCVGITGICNFRVIRRRWMSHRFQHF